MLDNIRRKLSHSNYKTFRNNTLDLCSGDNIVCYKNILCSISTERCTKKTSTKSFKPFQKLSKDISLGKVYMKMIFCPAGTFIMGHKDQWNNLPRTEVIDASFLLGQTEVTQKLYEAVVGTKPSKFKKRPQNPVEQVSWDDAIKFCNRLSELQGLDECYTENPKSLDYGWDCDSKKNGYRLPREKEWEYAAKAGTQNRWAGTDNIDELDKYAVYGANSEINGKKQTHPVGSKAPNEWGFYDMSGNVDEWCWDKSNPKDGDAAAYRVNRGGSWAHSNASGLCSADRSTYSPGRRYNFLGFRICRTLV